MARTLLAYATVVTLDEGRVLRPGWIGVEDGRIAFVSERPPEDAAWMKAPRVDAAGKIALPGLVNAHAHVGMTVMRGAAERVHRDLQLRRRCHRDLGGMRRPEPGLRRGEGFQKSPSIRERSPFLLYFF